MKNGKIVYESKNLIIRHYNDKIGLKERIVIERKKRQFSLDKFIK